MDTLDNERIIEENVNNSFNETSLDDRGKKNNIEAASNTKDALEVKNDPETKDSPKTENAPKVKEQTQKEKKKDNKSKKSKKKKRNKKKRNYNNWALLPEEMTKKASLILSTVSTAIGVMIFILFLFPAARVENVSLGNFYQVLIETVKYAFRNMDFINYEHTIFYGNEMVHLHLVTFACLIAGYSILKTGIKNFIEYFENKKTLGIYKFGIVKSAIIIFIEVALFVSLFIYIGLMEKIYSLSMIYQKIILILVIIEICICTAIKISYALRCERINNNKARHYVIHHTHKEFNNAKMQFVTAVLSLQVVVLIFFSIFTDNYYAIKDRTKLKECYLIYNPIIFSSYGDTLLVGEKTPNVDVEISYQDLVIGEVNYSKHKSWSHKRGTNYYYYMILIENIDKEIEELMPKDIPEDATMEELEESLGMYFEKLEKLYNKKQVLENQLSKIPYIVESYRCNDEGIVIEYVFNTNRIDKMEHQYGNAPITLLNLGKESIQIDQNKFEKGTDFSEIKIKATVIYSDGSFKISMITPENYEELNNASVGTHSVEWHDDWGNYSAVITIE